MAHKHWDSPWARNKVLPRIASWRGLRRLFLVAAMGFALGQAFQFDWEHASKSLDEAIWKQALKDRPAAAELWDASPVWREREGASGDKILERVDRTGRVEKQVAVIREMGGNALSSAVIPDRASAADDGKPAMLNALTAGDRLTITAGDGQVQLFEITPADLAAEPHATVLPMRLVVPTRDGTLAIYAVRPLSTQAAGEPTIQQDL